MQNKLYNTTIALAGMMQAIGLIKELAQTGKTDEAAFQTCIYSIFQTDPVDIPSVYQNLSHLRLGLETLIQVLGPERKKNHFILRHLFSLIHLQKKINQTPAVATHLKQRISQAKKQADYFSLTHPTVILSLADIYLNLINTFHLRIMIWGHPRLLNTPDVMEKIRALLLAGTRSAVLWKQTGGSRLQFIFFRNKLKAIAETLLSQINQHSTKEPAIL